MHDNIFKIVFVICFVAGCLIRVPYAKRGRRDDANNKRVLPMEWPLLLLVLAGMQVMPLIYLLTGWLDFADYGLPVWAGIAGAVAFIAALLLLWRSHADLGNNFSARLQIGEEHSLVTGGAYRYIRHPMYTAHLLWTIAQALLLQNWVAGPAFLVTLLPLCLLRIPKEEKMMLEHFGDEYRAYTDRTGRLFPRFRK